MSGRVSEEVAARMEEVTGGSSSGPGRGYGVPYIHRVGAPPKQKLAREIRDAVKETFFSDNPLRHFRGQTASGKLLIGFQALFPIAEWGRHYSVQKFKGDLVSGLTIASLCIPQVIN